MISGQSCAGAIKWNGWLYTVSRQVLARSSTRGLRTDFRAAVINMHGYQFGRCVVDCVDLAR
jgi:hypothetical protein